MTSDTVKCTRCRNVHTHSDREERLNSKYKGLVVHDSICPRCGCKSFYDMTPQMAWCWATGLIELGDAMPEAGANGNGAILIATGPKYALKGRLSAAARHGRGDSAGKLLVPGVPEATNDSEKLAALDEWLGWLGKRKSSDGVVFGHGVPKE
jgi:hypothetical protein